MSQTLGIVVPTMKCAAESSRMASYGAQPRERGAGGVKGGLVHMPRMCVAQITPTVALSILSVADPIRFRTACTVVGMLR